MYVIRGYSAISHPPTSLPTYLSTYIPRLLDTQLSISEQRRVDETNMLKDTLKTVTEGLSRAGTYLPTYLPTYLLPTYIHT